MRGVQVECGTLPVYKVVFLPHDHASHVYNVVCVYMSRVYATYITRAIVPKESTHDIIINESADTTKWNSLVK